MRASLSGRLFSFVLGMGLFGWLMFSAPAGAHTPQSAGPAAVPAAHLPWITRDYSFRLARVNAYRLLAALPALTDNPDWSAGAALHARYMVKTNQPTNYEEPTLYPDYFTTQGAEAAANSLLIFTDTVTFSEDEAVRFWMRSPFQALSLLDAELRQTGFGSYREADGGLQMAAALDVRRGWQAGAPAGVAYPVMWPAAGKTVDLRTYSGQDYPDPLAAPFCQADYRGLPILVQLGDGSRAVRLADIAPTVLLSSGGPLSHCAFSETEYPPNPNDGDYGKILLDTRDAVVLMPQSPLAAGQTYTVTVQAMVDNIPVAYTWSFHVAPDAGP